MASDTSHSRTDTPETDPDAQRRTFLKGVGASTVAASATMLAGCGGSGDAGDGGGSTPDGDGSGGGLGTSGSSDDEGESSAPSEQRYGGHLRAAISANITGIPGSLHGQFISGSGSDITNKMSWVWSNRLIEYVDGELQPSLATDWTIENEGRTIVFTLREGVTFHDGSEFNADDVVYTFNWAFRTDVPSNVPRYFPYIDGPEGVVEKRGDYEVAFTTENYQASFLGNFARNTTYIIPEGAYEGLDSPTDYGDIPENPPVGTGPFMFEESVSESSLTFSRYDDYWETDENDAQLPYLDQLTINLTQSPEPRFTAVSTGDVDVAASIPSNRVENLENQDGVEALVIEGARALRLAFNHPKWDPVQTPDMEAPPEGCPIPENLGGTEDAVAFKQATMHAINVDAINEAMFDGLAGANDSHMPSWHVVYRDAEQQGMLNHYDYNPDRATELFEQSIGDPSSIGTWNAHCEQEEAADQTALTIIQQNLSQLGFDVNAEPLLRPDGFANWEWGGEESETRSATCPTTPPEGQHTFLYQFDILTPDPSAWLGLNRWTAGVRGNRAHYLDASDLCVEASNATDPEERHQLFVDLLAKVNNDVAHGVLFWLPRIWAHRSNVRGLDVNPYLEYKFADVWLEN